MWDILLNVLLDTLLDSLKLLPFLFAAYLFIEWLEHKAGKRFESFLQRSGRLGPLIGGALGMVPQCGFSVLCANFYAGRIVSMGTVVAVMLATSDEALPLLLAEGGHSGQILMLLGAKFVIGVVTGFIVDLACRGRREQQVARHELCEHCGCEGHVGFVRGILLPALRHVASIMLFIFLVTLALNVAVELIGKESFAALLGADTIFQPVIAAVFGFIPNCAASVVITELYISGGISFGSAVAGLCTGAGAGMLMLFKANKNLKENFIIAGILFAAACISGIVLQLVM